MYILQLARRDKKQVDDFLHLPFSSYRDISQWMPPRLYAMLPLRGLDQIIGPRRFTILNGFGLLVGIQGESYNYEAY